MAQFQRKSSLEQFTDYLREELLQRRWTGGVPMHQRRPVFCLQ